MGWDLASPSWNSDTQGHSHGQDRERALSGGNQTMPLGKFRLQFSAYLRCRCEPSKIASLIRRCSYNIIDFVEVLTWGIASCMRR